MGYRGLVLDGRKLFVAVAGAVAALLVCGLMAAPALAQATAGDVDFQAVDCSQVQAALANQYNSGDAVALQYNSGAATGGDATAEIAQALNIDQSQVNECLSGNDAADGDVGDVDNEKDVLASTVSGKELPNTGGLPLSGAVASFALVAAGILLAGSIIRRSR